MKLWHYKSNHTENHGTLLLRHDHPTVIICAGGFSADNPAAVLENESRAVTRFFDFMCQITEKDGQTVRQDICCPLAQKLLLDRAMVRKVLGLVYPAESPDEQVHASSKGDPIDLLQVSYTGVNENFYNLAHHYDCKRTVNTAL